MANNYTDILALVNAGNNMGLSNTIKRDYGIPLDFTSVQETYDAAVAYAATSTLAYVGQTVAVGGKLYIITDVADGTHTVGEGEDAKTYDNYLAEVGSKTEGDGNTIELDGQTLKLAGLTGLDNSKTYVPSLINGKLVWAEPDTSTAEGQAQEINALKTRTAELEATVNGVEAAEGVEAKEGLVDKVASNAQAIADETAAREAAIGVASKPETAEGTGDAVVATGLYKVIEDAEARAKAYADSTVYDDTEVKEDIAANATAIEGLQTSIGNVYTKTEVDGKFEEVNNTIAGITHFTTEVVSSTDEVTKTGVLYLIKDANVEGVDKYNEYLYIEGQGAVLIGDTTTDLSDYVTNDALSTELAKYTTTEGLATVLAPYAKTETVNDALNSKANAADVVSNDTFDQFKTDNTDAIAAARTGAVSDVEAKGYAVATEVAETYATKATTLAGYGITDAYTKSETVAKGDVYTKTQVDALLDEVSGGSSETAASVKRALDGYIQNIDTELYGAETVAKWTSEDGTYTPQYSVDDSRIDTALANAAAAQTQADKGVADAAAVDAVAQQNKTDIAALTSQLAGTNGNVSSLTTRLAALETEIGTVTESRIDALEGSVESLSETVTTQGTDIRTLKETTIPAIQALIQANTDKFKDYSTTAQVTAAITAATENKLEAEDLEGYAKTSEIEAAYAKIGDAYTKAEADAEFMTQDEVDSRINALIVAADPEGGKTITNIQNLVEYVDENAGEITALIEASNHYEAVLDGIGGTDDTHKTVLEAINAAVNGVEPLAIATVDKLGGIKSAADTVDGDTAIKAINKVYVDATSGVAEVKAVSTDILVNGVDEFVIFGGDAGTVNSAE